MFVTFALLLSVGAAVEMTVTVKLLLPTLLIASVTEQLTVVVPSANVEPEAGEQCTIPGVLQLPPVTVGVA